MIPDDVPPGPICVDTDVFSWIYLHRARYREYWRLIQGHQLAVSFTTVGELRAGRLIDRWGARRSAHQEQVLREHYVVLTATDVVVSKYAEIQARFREQLKSGGVNDMWTSA